MKKKKVQYYESFNDDLVKSKNQNYQVPTDYQWNYNSLGKIILSNFIYFFFIIFGFIYTKLILRVTFKNKKVLKLYKNYFLYGNHTQPMGDAFNPHVLLFPKKPYIIVSPSNLGIPIIGKMLPFLGALPIPETIKQKQEFFDTIRTKAKNNVIIIYPEAHVWPWFTQIRPFSSSAFDFPVEENIPSFSMSTTYQKSKLWKKPKITIYIEGPFFAKGNSPREKRKDLCEQIFNSIQKNTQYNNYEYIEYKKRTTKS